MVKASEPFPNDITAVDWSSSGAFLIVGDRTGVIYSVMADTLKATDKANGFLAGKKNAWIEDLKISPDESMVAFGSHGGLSRLDLVKIINKGEKLQPFKQFNTKISSALTHLDWSIDSATVVLNSQAYELMWVDVRSL